MGIQTANFRWLIQKLGGLSVVLIRSDSKSAGEIAIRIPQEIDKRPNGSSLAKVLLHIATLFVTIPPNKQRSAFSVQGKKSEKRLWESAKDNT